MKSTIPADTSTLLQEMQAAGVSSRASEQALKTYDHGTIARHLQHLTPRKSTEIFKSQRADVLAELGRKILKTVDMTAIKSMAVRDRIMAMGIIYDKERIERGGQNGSNIKPMVSISIHGQVAVQVNQPVDSPVDNLKQAISIG